MGKTVRKLLEDRIKDGDIERGKPIVFRQNVEIQFQKDALKGLQESNKSFNLTESNGSTKTGKRKLVVTVEGIHTGMTKNMTFYPGNTLDESVPTWTAPHYKPVLKNHDTYTEPLGRIVKSEYVESTLTDKYTVRLTLELTDQDAIDKVLDGRYLTLSVGGSAQKVTCSVCAKDLISEGFCGHYRGRKYEGKTAHWIIGNYTGDEISFVNMPADVFSQVIAAELVSGEGGTNMGKGQKSSESAPGVNVAESDEDLIDGLLGEDEEGNGDPENPAKPNESDDNSDNGDPSNQTEGDDGDDDGNVTEGDDDEGDDDGAGDDTGNESVEDLKRKLSEAEKKAKDLQTKLDESEADNLTLSGELTEAKDKLSKAEADLTKVNEQLSACEDEKKTFVEQNIKLAQFAKKALAERVVDLRINQGKDKLEDRETALVEWAGCTSKVLQSTIKDLMKAPRQIASVTSPGYVTDNNDADGDDEGEKLAEGAKKPEKRRTLADFEKTMIESVHRPVY